MVSVSVAHSLKPLCDTAPYISYTLETRVVRCTSVTSLGIFFQLLQPLLLSHVSYSCTCLFCIFLCSSLVCINVPTGTGLRHLCRPSFSSYWQGGRPPPRTIVKGGNRLGPLGLGWLLACEVNTWTCANFKVQESCGARSVRVLRLPITGVMDAQNITSLSYLTLPTPHKGRAGGNAKVLPGPGWVGLARESPNKRHLRVLVAGAIMPGEAEESRYMGLHLAVGSQQRWGPAQIQSCQTRFRRGPFTLWDSWGKRGIHWCPSQPQHETRNHADAGQGANTEALISETHSSWKETPGSQVSGTGPCPISSTTTGD